MPNRAPNLLYFYTPKKGTYDIIKSVYMSLSELCSANSMDLVQSVDN